MEFKYWSFICGFLAGSSIYSIYRWLSRPRPRPRPAAKNEILTIDVSDDYLFFSPKIGSLKCMNSISEDCKYLSCPFCNYKKFIKQLFSAESTLDICVYLVTSEVLTKEIINLFRRGIFVRIIIDKQMSDEALNSKLYFFLREHIPIKVISSGEAMHNKFAIIDQKKVITGSFNWTKQAFLCNFENGVVIHNINIVQKYCVYFNEIWVSCS